MTTDEAGHPEEKVPSFNSFKLNRLDRGDAHLSAPARNIYYTGVLHLPAPTVVALTYKEQWL
jgi:hypothetical protein